LKGFSAIRYADYIENPKPNDYQSLHATLVGTPAEIISEGPIPVDLQIHTRKMHWVAEHGSAKLHSDKKRRHLVDHKLFLAITAFRYYLFGA
ncbi:unnamed protein product, partial [marine sediment metagenome]